jgi:hypothetical protein
MEITLKNMTIEQREFRNQLENTFSNLVNTTELFVSLYEDGSVEVDIYSGKNDTEKMITIQKWFTSRNAKVVSTVTASYGTTLTVK